MLITQGSWAGNQHGQKSAAIICILFFCACFFLYLFCDVVFIIVLLCCKHSSSVHTLEEKFSVVVFLSSVSVFIFFILLKSFISLFFSFIFIFYFFIVLHTDWFGDIFRMVKRERGGRGTERGWEGGTETGVGEVWGGRGGDYWFLMPCQLSRWEQRCVVFHTVLGNNW